MKTTWERTLQVLWIIAIPGVMLLGIPPFVVWAIQYITIGKINPFYLFIKQTH